MLQQKTPATGIWLHSWQLGNAEFVDMQTNACAQGQRS